MVVKRQPRIALVVSLLTLSCSREPRPLLARDAEARPLPTSNSTTALASRTVAPDFSEELVRRAFFAALERLSHDPAPLPPSHQLALGYLALKTKQHGRSVAALSGLEARLPEYATLIGRLRAEAELGTDAMLRGGSALLAAGRRPEEVWKTAFELASRGGHEQRVTEALERALEVLGDDPELRFYRARRLAAESLERAALDACHVAIEAPLPSFAVEAESLCVRGRGVPLTARERARRLSSLARGGAVELVDRESLNHKEPERSLVRARARAAARRDHERGAELFVKAVAGGARPPGPLLLEAARLAHRAGNGERTVALYDRLKGDRDLGAEARYYAARATLVFGHAKEAVRRYRRVVGSVVGAERARMARFELGLALLLNQRPKEAKTVWSSLESTEKDEIRRAQYLELAGVAAEQAGDVELAAELYARVLRAAPLELPGLFARARLQQLERPVPAPLGGAAPVPDEPQRTFLPGPAEPLRALGLIELSSEIFLQTKARANLDTRGLCEAWSLIGTAEQRYALSATLPKFAADQGPTSSTRWQWDCRYPRPYEALVEEVARTEQLPSELLYAVMRQESGFRPQVRSPAGALGLLQLMPRTAERVAGDMGWAEVGDLTEPRINITLGAHYLKRLLELFGNDWVLAVAAYNAGPEAVSRWARARPHTPKDVFASLIPYVETRSYVQRVLANAATYLFLSGGEPILPKLSLTLPAELPDPEAFY